MCIRDRVMPRHTETNGGVPFRIGDTITLDIGERISQEGEDVYKRQG